MYQNQSQWFMLILLLKFGFYFVCEFAHEHWCHKECVWLAENCLEELAFSFYLIGTRD